MEIKALSIQEPWLSMIINGDKTIETRSWKTNYRGGLLLVGCKKPAGEYAGLAACVVNLVDCRLMTPIDKLKAGGEELGLSGSWLLVNKYAWVFDNIRPITPMPIRGFQRIYTVDFIPKTIDQAEIVCPTCTTGHRKCSSMASCTRFSVGFETGENCPNINDFARTVQCPLPDGRRNKNYKRTVTMGYCHSYCGGRKEQSSILRKGSPKATCPLWREGNLECQRPLPGVLFPDPAVINKRKTT